MIRKWDREHPEQRKAINRAWAARWYVKNPEEGRRRARESMRKWREANPEVHRARSRGYAANHRREAVARVIAWEVANPERAKANHRAAYRRYRSRKLGSTEHHTAEEIAAVLLAQGDCCAVCRSSWRLEIDHILPLSRGGLDGPENIQILCRPCNRAKGNKTMREWLLSD